MPQYQNAEDIFRILRSHPVQGSEAQIQTGVRVNSGQVRAFLSLDGISGLVIPISAEDYRAFRVDMKSDALQLTKLTADGNPFARLSLRDMSQEKIFAIFVDELLKELEKTPGEAVSVASGMLQRWRRLFAGRISTEPFTPSQEIGILCELEVLRLLLDREGPQALNRWTGPEALPHDFELPEESIECKATASTNGLRISVHGAQQLTPAPGKTLRLAVRQYEVDPDGELSIPDICREIYERPDIPVEIFLEKLEKANCPIFHNPSGDVFQRYFPVGGFEFIVDRNFPRIDQIGPEQRIQQVSYTLDLSGPETVPGFQQTPQLLATRK